MPNEFVARNGIISRSNIVISGSSIFTLPITIDSGTSIINGRLLVNSPVDMGYIIQAEGGSSYFNDIYSSGSVQIRGYDTSQSTQNFNIQTGDGTAIADFRNNNFLILGAGQSGGEASGIVLRYNNTAGPQLSGYNFGNGSASYKPIFLDVDSVGRNQGIFTNYSSSTQPASTEFAVKGQGSTSSTYTAKFQNSSFSNTLVIRDDGNVGIGTSSPAALLNVSGSCVDFCTQISILGGTNNTISSNLSTIGGGSSNTINSNCSSIVGGIYNRACSSSEGSFVGGGCFNRVCMPYSSIVGGLCNYTGPSTGYHFIGGGVGNYASGWSAVNVGGNANTISSYMGTLTGGQSNTVNNGRAFLGGGFFNTISGNTAVVAGGESNIASGNCTSIGGGKSNTVSGCYGFAAGYLNNVSGPYAGAIGCGINATVACAFHVNKLVIKNIPTSNVGLTSGEVWSDAGTLKIMP
jgi:hypothetical protein